MSQTPTTRYKVHSSYIWLGSLGAIIAVLFALLVASGGSVISFLAGDAEDALAGLISFAAAGVGMIVVGVVIVLSRLFSYKHLYFTLTQDEFCLYSGIFNKQQIHVPYPRIQSVDQHATLLQRIFGTCTVSIDTAGGASNKAVQVPYLTKQQAEWLRAQLFTRKMHLEQAAVAAPVPAASASAQAPGTVQSGNVLDVGKQVWDEVGGVFAGSYQDAQPVSYEYGLTNKELLFAGISNNTAFVVIVVAILGVIGEIAPLIGDLFPRESTALYGNLSSSLATGSLMEGSILWASGMLIALMVFIWILSALGSCINYGGFRARRKGPRIEVEHGLLQHTLQGVNIDRVQAVVIKQTFIRRLIGYCELSLSRIDAQGDPSDGSQKNAQAQTGVIIHPFLKLSRANEVLSGLVPEYKDIPQETHALSPKALRRALVRRAIWQGAGFWCALCTALVQIIIHLALQADPTTSAQEALAVVGIVDPICIILYALALILFTFDIIGAVMWAKGSSFACNRRFMQVTNAGLSRETMNFPRNKIQYGCVRTNPLQRMAKTATICARTAAGIGGTTVSLIDVTEADAEAWLAWVEPAHAHREGTPCAPTAQAPDGDAAQGLQGGAA